MTTPDIRTTARLPWDAADPYPFYEACRQHGEVVWNDTAAAWLILGYHPAPADPRGARLDEQPAHQLQGPAPLRAKDPDNLRHNILFTDGADHLRLRSAVRDVFTCSFSAGLRDGIATIAAATTGSNPTEVEFDFMTDIALPLPIAVAGAWMGLDIGASAGRCARTFGHQQFGPPDTLAPQGIRLRPAGRRAR